MNTKLFVAGCVTVMSVALVSAQSGQSVRPAATTAKATTAQAPAAQPLVNKARSATTASAADVSTYRAMLDQYCVTCHNARLKTANLLLDQLDLNHLGDHAEIGEKVVRKLRAGMMPPTDMPRPDAAALDGFVHWMEGELDRAAVTHLPAPGLHRLNRTEYANAIRDLLGLEVDATKFLPADDSTHGFDNIAGALTMSPALMEAYLSAAGKISRLAIGDVSAPTQGRLRRATGYGAELPHRRTAVRNARRHADQVRIPGRRRIHLQGEGRHWLLPGGPRPDQRRATRSHGRWRAGEAVRLGSGNFQHDR